jgi:hypothetical protein
MVRSQVRSLASSSLASQSTSRTAGKLARSLVPIGVLLLLVSGCCFGSLPGMSAPDPFTVCQRASAIHTARYVDAPSSEITRVESECVTQLVSSQGAAPDDYNTLAQCVMAIDVPVGAPAAEAAEAALGACQVPGQLVVVASCANDMGVCSEWSGSTWFSLGFDNASRAAAAPSNSFPGCASTFRMGQACSLTGVFGRCVAPDRTTYYSNAGNAALVQDACSFMNGTWVAM